MPIQIDYGNSIIRITSPDTQIDVQTLHDYIEDERAMASPEGLVNAAILQPEGKIQDPVNPTIYSQIIIVLNSPWQIQFWGGSGYTRVFGGKVVGGLNDQPIKATGTAGDVTVLESPVDGITTVVQTGVSGLTAEESQILTNIKKAFLNNQVLTENATSNFTIMDDDGITPLFIFTVLDKDGNPIILPTGAPAKRTIVP